MNELEAMRLQMECPACSVRIADVGSWMMERTVYDCTEGEGCKFREHYEAKRVRERTKQR